MFVVGLVFVLVGLGLGVVGFDILVVVVFGCGGVGCNIVVEVDCFIWAGLELCDLGLGLWVGWLCGVWVWYFGVYLAVLCGRWGWYNIAFGFGVV